MGVNRSTDKKQRGGACEKLDYEHDDQWWLRILYLQHDDCDYSDQPLVSHRLQCHPLAQKEETIWHTTDTTQLHQAHKSRSTHYILTAVRGLIPGFTPSRGQWSTGWQTDSSDASSDTVIDIQLIWHSAIILMAEHVHVHASFDTGHSTTWWTPAWSAIRSALTVLSTWDIRWHLCEQPTWFTQKTWVTRHKIFAGKC